MASTTVLRAKPNDLFNFQGLRQRIILAPEYSHDDRRLTLDTPSVEQVTNEYDELDLTGDRFESLVRPNVDQSQWMADRRHERNELNRLGDLVDFYQHKPHLTEFEKRVFKRMTRCDRSMQTDVEPEKVRKSRNRNRLPAIRLPPPLAMEKVEEFLTNNHWRLVDLFRTLDREKSWNVIKEDFMRMAQNEQLDISEANADELILCFCRETQVSMRYKQFARGRSMYKKSVRESLNKTPSSIDTQLESDTSTTPSSQYLQLPPNDTTHQYPLRAKSTSAYSRSTKSSMAKYKSSSSSSTGTDSKLSTYA